ncbi:MAG: alpha/beta fold hydrolase [Promethearchaeota archaeon]
MNNREESTWKNGIVELNDIKLHYIRTGDGSGKTTLLMLHGMADNGACWSRVAKALEGDYDVIMIDERGHGQSTIKQTNFNFDLMADDISKVITTLGLEGTIIIGHSMGGQVGTMVAAKYPDLVSKIILEDPAYFMNPFVKLIARMILPLYLRKARKHGNKSVEELEQICRKNDPGWDEEDVKQWALSKQQFGRNLLEGDLKKVNTNVKWKAVFPKIQCPALLIIPSNGILSLRKAKQIMTLFKDCTIEFIEKSGHSVRRDQFDKYIKILRDFLSNNK